MIYFTKQQLTCYSTFYNDFCLILWIKELPYHCQTVKRLNLFCDVFYKTTIDLSYVSIPEHVWCPDIYALSMKRGFYFCGNCSTSEKNSVIYSQSEGKKSTAKCNPQHFLHIDSVLHKNIYIKLGK